MDLFIAFELTVVISVIAVLAYRRLYPTLRVKLSRGARMPRYMTEGAAGFDLHALLENDLRMVPGQVYAVPTGLRVAVPGGYELQVRSRSGLAKKHNVVVANAPGTVDSDYRGEVFVLLVNGGADYFDVKSGDRIAQGVVAPCVQVQLHSVEDLGATVRGSLGFGSTGI